MTSAADRHGAAPRSRSFDSGFTLLEVLLASALAATLLMSLWSLMSMQTRLFARTPFRLERSQLVRALYQQFADDLHSGIFIPEDDPAKVTRFLEAGPPGGSLSGSTAAAGSGQPMAGTSPPTADGMTATAAMRGTGRPSALIGTAQSLHLQVMQIPLPQTPTPAAEVERLGPDVDQQYGPRVPELRDISYSFYPPDMIGVDRLTYQAGLVRREIAWDAVDSQTGAASVPWIFRPESSDPATDADDTGFGPNEPSSRATTETSQRDSVTYVPEVAGIEFRYFDGNSWSSDWDSHQRRGLPIAVEVVVDFGNRESARTSAAEAKMAAESNLAEPIDTSPPETTEPSDLTTNQQPAVNPNVYRFVIFMTSGSRQRESSVPAAGGSGP